MSGRIVELAGVFNMRDLGGLRSRSGSTAHGVLYRSDSLDNPTQPDQQILLSRLRIGKVIDLRTFEEVRLSMNGKRTPSSPGFEVSRIQIPLIAEGRIGREPFPSDNPKELAKVYLENVTTGSDAVRAIVAEIAESVSRQVPCVFHCAAGRDRTGVIAGLLLEFLGVDRADIAEDYIQSNHHAREVTLELKRSPLYKNSSAGNDHALLLHAETILNFLDSLSQRFGGAEQYLREVGVEGSQLEGLKAGMLT